ncbi:hypothetical protein VHA01S_030_00370 [Vibrio halioticoli NBRC 102217]|uniref:DUF4400 domain-containing protein n=1 Tax=Vibrio halioticoli NBRC 102217 TaxID=1219072 RepID=V5FM83_9VIBR|nr:DUF4400 domain-containing protein [Vibrio halioticoli]GAD89962.1 hypothetical protein VHA01S_030_00370 [Vibrio halioticoli NBRC 102217]
MADEFEGRFSTKPLWLVVIIVVSQIIFLASLVSPQSVRESMVSEVQYMRTVYGDDSTFSIYNDAQNMSDKVLYDSGFESKVKAFFLPEEYRRTKQVTDMKNFNTGFWDVSERVIDGFFVNAEFAILRIYAVKPWLLMMLLVVTASLVTGLMQREVKKHGFEFSSPLRHGLARRLLYILPLLLYLTVVTPLAMPPYIYPTILGFVGLAIMLIVSNTIKRV